MLVVEVDLLKVVAELKVLEVVVLVVMELLVVV